MVGLVSEAHRKDGQYYPPYTIKNILAVPYQTTKSHLGPDVPSAGKLDLLVYWPLMGRCPHCKSALIAANSVGKRKLCYAIPWPKTIVSVDMRCGRCKKHFMTHDTKYVDTLPSAEQMKRELVTAKGNGSHTSPLCLLRSGMTVAQVEQYIEDEVRECYLQMKANYIDLWDKVLIY